MTEQTLTESAREWRQLDKPPFVAPISNTARFFREFTLAKVDISMRQRGALSSMEVSPHNKSDARLDTKIAICRAHSLANANKDNYFR